MKQSKNLNKYKKPKIVKYGNMKELTQGNWTGGDDGIPTRGSE